MTKTLRTTIHFHKFREDPIQIEFQSGLHLILGEAGVGKSAFIQQLAGQHEVKANFRVKVLGQSGRLRIVPQNPDNQLMNPTLGDELAFTEECTGIPDNIIRANIQRQVEVWPFLSDLGRHPDTLSGGEKEILNLITAYSETPDILLLDDSLSFLSPTMKEHVHRRIFMPFLAAGKTILWFSPDPADLKYGKFHWELTLSAFTPLAVQAKTTYHFPAPKPGYLSCRMDDLQVTLGTRNIIKGLSCHGTGIRCLGISGENGSGKTTLAKVILGLQNVEGYGIDVLVHGKKPKIGYLDQFPERLTGVTTVDSFLHKLQEHGILHERGKEAFFRQLSHHNISWKAVRSIPTDQLSWTLIRFILIMIFIHCDFDLLILDEPTFGLGHGDKLTLGAILAEYLHVKHAILISHDIAFLRGVCDTILSLEHRAIVSVKESKIIHG
ncbi:MAG: ATP-binding cassette domain-containing protein [Fidelibacterota bacterium]